jgi:hypothetical protein
MFRGLDAWMPASGAVGILLYAKTLYENSEQRQQPLVYAMAVEAVQSALNR